MPLLAPKQRDPIAAIRYPQVLAFRWKDFRVKFKHCRGETKPSFSASSGGRQGGKDGETRLLSSR